MLVAGGLIWGGAVLWFVERVGVQPDFLGEWLPGIVLLGIGAGTLFPNLSGVAVASAPGESFATATGLNSVSRQVGAALGVAVVVAIIGTPSPLQALDAFDHAWTFGGRRACSSPASAACSSGAWPAARRPRSARRRGWCCDEPAPTRRRQPRPRARRAISVDGCRARRHRGPSRRPHFLARVAAVRRARAGAARAARRARASRCALDAGEWLFREGDPGDAMYLVRAGRLEVVDEAPAHVIRELGRGDALGELALLTELAALGVGPGRACERPAGDRARATSSSCCTSSPALVACR